ncbi:reprolysin-like metallopeptidase [Epilithonimonas pallida]|uniref:Por secretion system C-terminal sorting domain-containing protein n=1 Tax=Epilithonimonas pallida TaxID=373671 RepID=A0ABY1R2X8_9FLAO|nr:zinc-dependent metalloprotease family protein [Epilithonimonas pallida]SMP92824.1 Por secretion system C-terminal sorting domain-containing protein [Epilithonimonas pallida]
MIKHLLTATGIMASMLLSAQKNFWTPVQNLSVAGKSGLKDRKTLPTEYKIFSLNVDGIKSELDKAPNRGTQNESLVLKFPNASGKLVDYVIQEAAVMEKELSDKYPGIKSYLGYQKDNNNNTIRFSISPFDGMNVMYFDNWEVSYMDSYSNDLSNYIVYKRTSLPADPERFNCDFEKVNIQTPPTAEPIKLKAAIVKDGLLRKYRLALSSTVEYSNYHINRAGLSGGTTDQKKAAVLAAMNTTMTRVNGVYEKTVSLTMVMIANNDLLLSIGTDAYGPGFTNNDGSALLSENQAFTDQTVGTAAYDIGHIFSTGGGGIASLQSPCNSSRKAMGVTGSSAPRADAYDIDYVAHEMGHQFGGNHTFRANTSDAGSCYGNSNTATSVEPGSGSTIMAYAGICGSTYNLQAHSDPYFHSVSVNEMYNFITRTTDCSAKTANNNGVPTADAGPDYTIPYGTAFVLTGAGTDPDGDALTYLWEQTDYASLSATNPQPPVATATGGTVFRSYNPTTSNQRYFPAMASVAANTLTPKWEVIPNVARTLNFSLLVNDNKATGNQSARDLMKVTVANTGPFKVTSQTVAANYTGGSQITVTWDVAGTNAAPINTQDVQILLSSDNGLTFNTVLADAPNTGSAVVTLPNESNGNARIMVKAVNNIYFAVNSARFNINKNLAVDESAFNKGFAIYPNPAKGEVNISLNSITKGATYQIVDLSGRLISNGSLENEKTKVNISNLKPGTYKIVISNNGETTSKNLIVK